MSLRCLYVCMILLSSSGGCHAIDSFPESEGSRVLDAGAELSDLGSDADAVQDLAGPEDMRYQDISTAACGELVEPSGPELRLSDLMNFEPRHLKQEIALTAIPHEDHQDYFLAFTDDIPGILQVHLTSTPSLDEVDLLLPDDGLSVDSVVVGRRQNQLVVGAVRSQCPQTGKDYHYGVTSLEALPEVSLEASSLVGCTETGRLSLLEFTGGFNPYDPAQSRDTRMVWLEDGEAFRSVGSPLDLDGGESFFSIPAGRTFNSGGGAISTSGELFVARADFGLSPSTQFWDATQDQIGFQPFVVQAGIESFSIVHLRDQRYLVVDAVPNRPDNLARVYQYDADTKVLDNPISNLLTLPDRQASTNISLAAYAGGVILVEWFLEESITTVYMTPIEVREVDDSALRLSAGPEVRWSTGVQTAIDLSRSIAHREGCDLVVGTLRLSEGGTEDIIDFEVFRWQNYFPADE